MVSYPDKELLFIKKDIRVYKLNEKQIEISKLGTEKSVVYFGNNELLEELLKMVDAYNG